MPKNMMAAYIQENKKVKQRVNDLLEEVYVMKGFTLQQALDIAEITLHLKFEFGPNRILKFEDEFKQLFLRLAKDVVEEGAADGELIYSKSVIDRALIQARGESTLPFDERYATERLYFKDRDLK